MLNINVRLILILLFFIFNQFQLKAQTDDNIIWATLKLQKKLDSKTTIGIAPIFRINEEITNYQNSSVDYYIKRKIAKGWSAQLLGRTWFIPDGFDRQFIWLDVAYGKAIDKFSINSSLRLHWALDLGEDRPDNDFIRWKTTISYKVGKLKPSFAIEPWLRLNGFGEYQRIRYELGLQYQITPEFSAGFTYRRENFKNVSPIREFNHFLPIFVYTFQ